MSDDPPLTGPEGPMLQAFLDFYRAELLQRADGLTHDQMQVALTDSGLTLSRLIGHMAFVEYIWFAFRLDGDVIPEPFAGLDFEADDDAEMTHAQALPIDELRALFDTAVADSNRRIAAKDSLDHETQQTNRDDQRWNLRWIMIHMIEEYARHCGHADLIRESIDGNLADP